MNDCENEVFTRIATVLRAEFPGIDLASEYVRSPSVFPHVSVWMADNSIIPERQDTGTTETDLVMFEVNIFSNKANTKKSECKAIAKVIDSLLYSMNFRRLALTPVPNMENASIYRIVARYRVATDGKYFYRR